MEYISYLCTIRLIFSKDLPQRVFFLRKQINLKKAVRARSINRFPICYMPCSNTEPPCFFELRPSITLERPKGID
ncbi:MAG: hypothetical protein K6C10_04375 [Prevotella sp.]|nr:hypothetical protein [Prevotella sp.]